MTPETSDPLGREGHSPNSLKHVLYPVRSILVSTVFSVICSVKRRLACFLSTFLADAIDVDALPSRCEFSRHRDSLDHLLC